MTREEFVHGYCTRSGFPDYKLDGERVLLGDDWEMLALPCRCEEEGCEGWAMIPKHGRGWHLAQNREAGQGPTFAEAVAMDRAVMEEERALRTTDATAREGWGVR